MVQAALLAGKETNKTHIGKIKTFPLPTQT